jgi:hypothetical protein
MTPREAEKLLGGYAAGNLTPEEERALAEAALSDQDLFDALAREQSLRDLMADPLARRGLLSALGQSEQRRWRLFRRVALPAAAAVAATVAIGIYIARKPAPPVQVAQLVEPKPPAPIQAAPAMLSSEESKPRPQPREDAAGPRRRNVRRLPAPARPDRAEEKVSGGAQPAQAPPPPEPGPKSVASLGLQAMEAQQNAAPGAVDFRDSGAPRPQGGIGGLPASPPPQEHAQAKLTAARPQIESRRKDVQAAPISTVILRRQPDGSFADAPAGGLSVTDTVRLRFVAGSEGYIYLAERRAGGVIDRLASSRVDRGKPFDVTLDPPAGPVIRELVVFFSATPSEPGPQEVLSGGTPITLSYR